MLSSRYLPARDRGRAVLLGDDVEVVEPGGAAQLRQEARAAGAGELRRGGGELRDLEGREIRGRAVEQHPRQHLVLRQRRVGGEGDPRRRDPAVDGDDRGHVAGLGLGDEVDLRVEVADQLQRALVEVDALAEHEQPAAAQVELADRLDVGGGALDPQRAAELDVEAAAAHEDLVRRVDPHVEADAGAGRARARLRGAPIRARSRVICTGGGVATCSTCSSAACEAPSPSAIEISVRPRSMVAGEQAAAADQRAGQRQRRR